MSGESEKLQFISVATDDLETGGVPESHGQSMPVEPPLKFIRDAKHPVAAAFHLLFKVGAILAYLFGSMLSDNFIFIFVVCILFLVFDFWTVKNVTGRLLVGLRWWSHVNEDGTNEWVFESLEDLTELGDMDTKIFWYGLYTTPAIWGVLLVVGALKFNFQYLIIVVVALGLSAANIIGYFKCKKDSKAKLKQMMAAGAMNAMTGGSGQGQQQGGGSMEGMFWGGVLDRFAARM